MRAEQVAEIAADIIQDYESLEVSSKLDGLIAALENQSASPSEENQKAVSESKARLVEALSESRFYNYPIGFQPTLEEMEISAFLAPEIKEGITNALEGNDLTPATALENVKKVKENVDKILLKSRAFIRSAEFFEIRPDAPIEGEFEFSIAIPRAAVDNELDNFGRELVKLDKMLGLFCELATGSRNDFKIRAISSSDLTVILDSLPAVAVLLATTLERLASVYERMLNIIQLHRQMKESKVPDPMIKDMEKFVTKTLKSELAAAAKELEGKHLRKVDAGRRNELRMELRRVLEELAARFDQGYIFDVRGSNPGGGDQRPEDEAENSPQWQRRVVAEKRERLKYFKVEDEPILGLTSEIAPDDEPPLPKA